MSTRASRLETANKALGTFAPAVRLYDGARELRMCWDARVQPPKRDFAARLRSDGSWPLYGYRQRPCGGTGMQAIAQLIRYVRDLSRLPIDTWEYWGGHSVQLCTAETVDILRGGGYADPKKTACVLCGKGTFKGGLDWWSLDGVTGPCCMHGRCIMPSADPVGNVRAVEVRT